MTLTLASVVLAAAVGGDGPAAATAPTPADDLRLLVPSARTGPADLFLVDPASGNTRNVTATAADEEVFPAWSPDGKRVAFCCRNKDHGFEVYVCDADGANRTQLTAPPPGNPPPVAACPTWSPDGKRIAYTRLHANDRGELRVMSADGADDERVAADGLFPAWSPDGKRIAVVQAGDGKSPRLTTMKPDGSDAVVLIETLGQKVLCMPAWSPDSQLVAYTAETPYGVQLFVIPAAGGTPRQLTHLIGLNANPVWIGPDRLMFAHFAVAGGNASGGAYATVKADGTRLEVHPLTRTEAAHPLIRPAALVPPAAARPTTPEPAAAKAPFTIMPEVIHPPFAPGGAPGLAWSADGKRLAFGLDAGGVVLADFDGRRLYPADAFRGHEGPVEAVAFAPAGDRLFSTGADKSVRLWDLNLKGAKAIETDHEAAAAGLAVSPDGKQVASAGADGLVKVRAADTGKPVREFPLSPRKVAVRAVAYGKDGALFAAGGKWDLPISGGAVAAFDPQTGDAKWRAAGPFGGVWALAVSPDGAKLAGACLDCCVRVWDAKTGAELGCWQGHADRVTGVCWSPDGKAVVSCGFDHTVRIWDAATGRPAGLLAAHAGPVMRVAFSPTGSHFASTGLAGAVIVWRVTGE